ncbi:MAG: hypothetical protein COW01_02960 [Bdellovibrionales bacterium CG12_big_fil_rev_8_21_14_0_65_38_15]|nr:MAG: hypothetical protein COW01_02960 [Bdellovibrionales bacterium CG12_big_fil_rev_8_21_14_0_65_38_15]
MKRLILLLLLLPNLSHAYVENVTHGYVNCMACHISQSGGGVLSDYGRSLSKELMSTWKGWDGIEKPVLGLVSNTESLKLGGNFRSIQTHLKNDNISQGKAFVMQQNIEIAARYMDLWVVATAGVQGGPSETPTKNNFLSERHYISWDVNDEIKLRGGKFRRNYGLNDPTHTRLTKSPLGFGSNSETYQLEFSKFSETDELFIATDFGDINKPKATTTEKSFLFNYARYIEGKSKLGFNYLYGESGTTRRNLFGLYSIQKLPNDFYFKGEIDYQQNFSGDTKTNLIATTNTFGYQGFKGFLPYLVTEFLQRDLKKHNTRTDLAGIGVQWFPLAHFEFQFEFQKRNDRTTRKITSDVSWLMFHFFL